MLHYKATRMHYGKGKYSLRGELKHWSYSGFPNTHSAESAT